MKTLLLSLRRDLRAAANPIKAPQMQAYMKSRMPYHGVQSPFAKRIYRKNFEAVSFASSAEWQKQVRYIWDNAKFREERYGAIALCAVKQVREFQDPGAMKLYENLIVTGAWWDYVDDIAGRRVAFILENHPAAMKKKMRAWSQDANMWKRRTSIICQLPFKKKTDLALLFACIEPSLSSKEFFLQKAIGWALRQYAWTDPAEVRRYVKINKNRLAKLSIREALKNI